MPRSRLGDVMFKRKEKNISDSEAIKSLPHNRKEVFFDLLKHRKMALFALSCLVFMFFIPLAVDLFYFNFLEAAAIAADKNEYLFSLLFYSMIIMLPCMLIGFLGLAGGFHVAKKMVWQEGVSTSFDFFQGIKENWKIALLNGAIFGILLFGFVVGGSYLLIFAPMEPIWCGIGIGALILILLLFGMVIVLNFTQGVYYENPLRATFKNSFSFLALLNWKIFVIFLLSTGAVISLCCFNFITMAIGLFLFAILNSVVIILYTLVSHSAFDKYINEEHHPEMVGKGLYKVVLNDEDKKEA